MKMNVKAFTLAFSIIMTLLILVLSTWSRISTVFGVEFMMAFQSIHPHPFPGTPGTDLPGNALGVLFDGAYALVDSVIFSLAFTFLYNRFARSSDEDSGS